VRVSPETAFSGGQYILVVDDRSAGVGGEFFWFFHKKPPFFLVRLKSNYHPITVDNNLHLITKKIIIPS
jgi:hypothetical protein